MSTDIFKNNQNLKQVFVTSDGEKFYHKNDAYNHAKNLKDKSVEPVFNPKFLEVVDEEVLEEAPIETELQPIEVIEPKEQVLQDSSAETEKEVIVDKPTEKAIVKPTTNKK